MVVKKFMEKSFFNFSFCYGFENLWVIGFWFLICGKNKLRCVFFFGFWYWWKIKFLVFLVLVLVLVSISVPTPGSWISHHRTSCRLCDEGRGRGKWRNITFTNVLGSVFNNFSFYINSLTNLFEIFSKSRRGNFIPRLGINYARSWLIDNYTHERRREIINEENAKTLL